MDSLTTILRGILVPHLFVPSVLYGTNPFSNEDKTGDVGWLVGWLVGWWLVDCLLTCLLTCLIDRLID